jgi:hypothetical protein
VIGPIAFLGNRRRVANSATLRYTYTCVRDSGNPGQASAGSARCIDNPGRNGIERKKSPGKKTAGAETCIDLKRI